MTLSKADDFGTCTEPLTEERRNAAYDQELVLRFFAFKNSRERFRHDVKDFLTEYMEAVSEPDEERTAFDYNAQRAEFMKTFQILSNTLGERAFSYPNRQRTDLTRSFSVYHFEAFTIGIQSRLSAIDPQDANIIQRLRDILRQIKFEPDFIRITTGGGKNSPGPLNDRIGFVQRRIEQNI